MPPYQIKSVRTNFYVLSTQQDKVGQQVDTANGKDNIPQHSVLNINPRIVEPITIAPITGVTGLYVALMDDAEKTKLTWSDKPYSWVIREILPQSQIYVITPATGKDLYWFDEFDAGVGDHVEVRSGANVRPPQNEWFISPAIF